MGSKIIKKNGSILTKWKYFVENDEKTEKMWW